MPRHPPPYRGPVIPSKVIFGCGHGFRTQRPTPQDDYVYAPFVVCAYCQDPVATYNCVGRDPSNPSLPDFNNPYCMFLATFVRTRFSLQTTNMHMEEEYAQFHGIQLYLQLGPQHILLDEEDHGHSDGN